MIFIELEAAAPRRFSLEFHPRLTIVAGLEPEERESLVSALNLAMTGEEVGLEISVDVDGEPQPLTPSLAHTLGWYRVAIDNVIRVGDLPGVGVAGAAPTSTLPFEPPLAANQPVPTAVVTEADVAAANEDLLAALAALEAITARLVDHSANKPAEPLKFDLEEAIEQQNAAEERVRRLQDALLDLASSAQEPPEQKVARLNNIKGAIERRINELRDAFDADSKASVVREALIKADAPAGAADSVVAAVPVAPQNAPAWLVEQTQQDLEAAQARVAELEEKAAHGTAVSQSLSEAKVALRDAQAVWAELTGVPQAPDHDLPDARAILIELMGSLGAVDPHLDPIGAARDWLEEHAFSPEQRTVLEQDLSGAMLDLGDINSEIESAETAAQFVDSDADEEARFQHELQEAQRDAAEAAELVGRLRLAETGPSTEDQRLNSALRSAEHAVEVANERFRLLISAFESGEGVEDVPSPNRSTPPSRENPADRRPWWETASLAPEAQSAPLIDPEAVDVSRVSSEDAEFYVLSRVAGLRRVGRGEAAPVLIDAAFDRLPQDVAFRIFDALPKVTPIVQIIYLAGNDLGERWVSRHPETIAAVCRLMGPDDQPRPEA